MSRVNAKPSGRPDAALRDVDHWVAGAIRTGPGAERLVITDPRSGTPVAQAALGGAADVDAAVTDSWRAQESWAATPSAERGRVLKRIGQRLLERGDEFVDVECQETGKLVAEMQGSLRDAAEYFEYYGGVIRAFAGETIELGASQHAFTRREPFGVVGMVTPWNSPLTQAARGLSAALAVGNAVVIKPSEFTPSTTPMLAELAHDAGLPPGILNVVIGTGASVGEPLFNHPQVDKISFTGSVATGRRVAQAAANRFVSATLELGGKSPNIVFADADLDAASRSAAGISRFAGQVCAALSRLLVEDSIYDEFVDRVGARIASMKPGESVAPITTEAQARKVESFFQAAKDEGLRLVAGGQTAAGPGIATDRYMCPTLYADVSRSSRLFREEIFGPVLAATRFTSEDDAIEIGNDSDYGLVANVWTRDLSRAFRMSRRLHAGQVVINGGRTGVDTAFGGYKASGLGRETGLEAMHDYTQLKTTVIGLG